MSTTATAPAISREIIEDRWEGLTNPGDEWSPLMVKLDRILDRFYEGLARRAWTGERGGERRDDGRLLDGSGDVTVAVHDAIRRTFIDEISRMGNAR